MTPSAMMELLEAKVPLTLLLDLTDPGRIPSTSILRHEPADLSWLASPVAPRRSQERLDH